MKVLKNVAEILSQLIVLYFFLKIYSLIDPTYVLSRQAYTLSLAVMILYRVVDLGR